MLAAPLWGVATGLAALVFVHGPKPGPKPGPDSTAARGSTVSSPPSAVDAGVDTGGASSGVVYNGSLGQVAVKIPRINADVPIDGNLTAAPWQQAAVLTGFSSYLPVDGEPATDSTEVLIWYSPTAIYFGIRAYEAHGAPHAAMANRDKIDADDNVQILLRTFPSSHQAWLFAVNAFGIQEDGTITEGSTATRGFGVSQQTGPPPYDLSPDYVYESKGILTPWGYQVVVKIPFRTLKYQSQDPQDWGINILRVVQHIGQISSWYPAKLAAASFLPQSGALVGLTKLSSGLVLDLNPFVTAKVIGTPAEPTGWNYGFERPQFGANVRWGITNSLLFSGTFRPDFAEVESDATQLVFDPRNSVAYPEKRPFFLDNLEQFNTPNNLVYTRQIEAPLAAAKLTGSFGNVNIAYLGAKDQEPEPPVGASGQPIFNIVRVLSTFGSAAQVGAVATDKEWGADYNRVGELDTRFTWNKIWSFAAQGGISNTNTGGVVQTGPLWQGHLIRGGRTLVLDYNLSGISENFITQSGFISRNGIANGSADQRLTFYPQSPIFATVGADFSLSYTWVYDNFIALQAPEDRRYHFTALTTLRGGWSLLAAIYFEEYGYDPSLYGNYYLGHINTTCSPVCATDTTYSHFVGTPTIPNTDYVFQVSSPLFSTVDFTLLQLAGRDENFFEWSAADISFTEATMNWRPTNQLRFQFMYNAQIYWRHSDHTIVGSTLIPRIDAEYQLSRPIFIRIIGQYTSGYQGNLRDDSRTNLPIFYGSSPTGPFTPAAAFKNNQLQGSFLFAYQPIPGTVGFLGYGNTTTEPNAFHLWTLTRVADNFFVKFSYLFRM
jgi:hypothetical protein